MVVEGLGELGANEFAETAESFVGQDSMSLGAKTLDPSLLNIVRLYLNVFPP